MGRGERETEGRAQKLLRPGRAGVAEELHADPPQNCARTVGRVKGGLAPRAVGVAGGAASGEDRHVSLQSDGGEEWEWKEETQMRPAAPVFGSGRVTAMPYGESSGVSPSFDKVPTTPPRETTRTQLFE